MDFNRLMDINAHRLGFTYGYIGNLVEHGPCQRDDRQWFVFKPHPGRPGEVRDRIGKGYSTANRFRLFDDLWPWMMAQLGQPESTFTAAEMALRASWR